MTSELGLDSLSVGEHVVDGTLDPFDEASIELDRAVVRGDCLLDFVDRDVAGIAVPVMTPDAEEVEVLDLVSSYRSLYDESVVGDAALELALAAEHAAFEVLLIDPPAFPRPPTLLEHGLNLIEQVAIDQSRVAAVEYFALVCDLPDVVGLSE
ncbi:hypothetical protein GCM10010489_29900 [Microbacterium saperdae]|nr:hypothetical protein [Microbacterium saperdae]GGM56303.1 hypothetical protein GCM10010489_29900 [Microbacterium saperdae]